MRNPELRLEWVVDPSAAGVLCGLCNDFVPVPRLEIRLGTTPTARGLCGECVADVVTHAVGAQDLADAMSGDSFYVLKRAKERHDKAESRD